MPIVCMIVENPPKELIKIINAVINFLSALIFPAIYIPLVISVMPQITAGTMSFLNGITFMYADNHVFGGVKNGIINDVCHA